MCTFRTCVILCYYVSNPELQKDICFFLQLSSEPLLEEDRASEAGTLSQAADFLVQIFPLPTVTHCTLLKVLLQFTLLSNELYIFSGFDYMYSATVVTETKTGSVWQNNCNRLHSITVINWTFPLSVNHFYLISEREDDSLWKAN